MFCARHFETVEVSFSHQPFTHWFSLVSWLSNYYLDCCQTAISFHHLSLVVSWHCTLQKSFLFSLFFVDPCFIQWAITQFYHYLSALWSFPSFLASKMAQAHLQLSLIEPFIFPRSLNARPSCGERRSPRGQPWSPPCPGIVLLLQGPSGSQTSSWPPSLISKDSARPGRDHSHLFRCSQSNVLAESDKTAYL